MLLFKKLKVITANERRKDEINMKTTENCTINKRFRNKRRKTVKNKNEKKNNKRNVIDTQLKFKTTCFYVNNCEHILLCFFTHFLHWINAFCEDVEVVTAKKTFTKRNTQFFNYILLVNFSLITSMVCEIDSMSSLHLSLNSESLAALTQPCALNRADDNCDMTADLFCSLR